MVNLVGSEIKGSLNFQGLEVNGFLSLAKARISENLDFRNIKVKNSEYEGLTIMGDLYLNQAIIQGGIDLTQAFIGGNLDLSVICVQNSVDLTLADIGNVLFLRDALIKGDLILNETKYKKMIKHFI